MKIGIVITHPTQFDVPIFKLGHNVIEVIYTDRRRVVEIYDPELKQTVKWAEGNLEGYKYEIVPEKYPLQWLFNKIRTAKYDLLITSGYFTKIYLSSILFGKFFSKKNALRVDSVLYNNKGIIKNVYKYSLFTVFKFFINQFYVVGTLSKQYLIKYGITEKHISNYGYISDNEFFSKGSAISADQKFQLRNMLGIAPDAKVLICISKHSGREAPFDTLNAYKMVQTEGSLHLLLVGDGPLHQKLKDLAISLQLKNITFAGYVNFVELPKYYSISNVFVHDSHDEPWGVSVQEAIACGLPVLASDKVGAAYDLIESGENGYVFKAGDVNELAEKIRMVLSLKNDAIMSTNKLILKNWNYERILDNIISTAY